MFFHLTIISELLVSLIYEMQRRNSLYGCASLCVGGGPAMATVLEMCQE
ncbi:MAG: hypothetical protein IKL51_08545 [Lachnospiraceae bacterium]|nr:hypothetical protein [Lachnospiraceae bacterium]